MTTADILKAAKSAKESAWKLTSEQKNKALYAIADALTSGADKILSANAEDVNAARGVISDVMLDRLSLSASRIEGMAKGVRDVAALDDPCGRILDEHIRDDGLKITKVSVPFGVIEVIYESRPNVTSDAAALSLKSGNVCVLRSGKEAYRTSKVIVDIMRGAIEGIGLDP